MQGLKKFNKNVLFIANLKQGEKLIYCKKFNLNQLIHEQDKWTTLHLIFNLPKKNYVDAEIELFIHNSNKNDLYIDDIEVYAY